MAKVNSQQEKTVFPIAKISSRKTQKLAIRKIKLTRKNLVLHGRSPMLG